MALTLQKLEELVARGCATPGCDHDHSVLFLTGRCHPGYGNYLIYTPPAALQILCACCDRTILILDASAEPGEDFSDLCCPEHLDAPLFTSYRAGSGQIKVECSDCHKVLGYFVMESVS